MWRRQHSRSFSINWAICLPFLSRNDKAAVKVAIAFEKTRKVSGRPVTRPKFRRRRRRNRIIRVVAAARLYTHTFIYLWGRTDGGLLTSSRVLKFNRQFVEFGNNIVGRVFIVIKLFASHFNRLEPVLCRNSLNYSDGSAFVVHYKFGSPPLLIEFLRQEGDESL